MTEERDYAAAIRTLAPRLWCVHTCENDRGVPGGGLAPWDASSTRYTKLATTAR
jgi:sugar phosphate isomerase/epimerase